MLVAVVVLIAVVGALALELRRAHDRADLEAAGRRAEAARRAEAEVMSARFEEAVVALEHRRKHAERVIKVERTRGDGLDDVLHDAVVLLHEHRIAFDRHLVAGPLKRAANHAAGPELARSDADLDATTARRRGEHPTNPGVLPPAIWPEGRPTEVP